MKKKFKVMFTPAVINPVSFKPVYCFVVRPINEDGSFGKTFKIETDDELLELSKEHDVILDIESYIRMKQSMDRISTDISISAINLIDPLTFKLTTTVSLGNQISYDTPANGTVKIIYDATKEFFNGRLTEILAESNEALVIRKA